MRKKDHRFLIKPKLRKKRTGLYKIYKSFKEREKWRQVLNIQKKFEKIQENYSDINDYTKTPVFVVCGKIN